MFSRWNLIRKSRLFYLLLACYCNMIIQAIVIWLFKLDWGNYFRELSSDIKWIISFQLIGSLSGNNLINWGHRIIERERIIVFRMLWKSRLSALSQNHFFREEPMCKAIAFLEDQTSVNAYLNFLRIWMKDTTSLVALSLTSGRIVGVAVLRINSDSDKSDIYNRVQVRAVRCNLKLWKHVTRIASDMSFCNDCVDLNI